MKCGFKWRIHDLRCPLNGEVGVKYLLLLFNQSLWRNPCQQAANLRLQGFSACQGTLGHVARKWRKSRIEPPTLGFVDYCWLPFPKELSERVQLNCKSLTLCGETHWLHSSTAREGFVHVGPAAFWWYWGGSFSYTTAVDNRQNGFITLFIYMSIYCKPTVCSCWQYQSMAIIGFHLMHMNILHTH